MKIIITPIQNLNAVRHNLSQPEEVERVWLTLDKRYAAMIGLSYGVTQRKATLRVPNHYMFFATLNGSSNKGTTTIRFDCTRPLAADRARERC